MFMFAFPENGSFLSGVPFAHSGMELITCGEFAFADGTPTIGRNTSLVESRTVSSIRRHDEHFGDMNMPVYIQSTKMYIMYETRIFYDFCSSAA